MKLSICVKCPQCSYGSYTFYKKANIYCKACDGEWHCTTHIGWIDDTGPEKIESRDKRFFVPKRCPYKLEQLLHGD